MVQPNRMSSWKEAKAKGQSAQGKRLNLKTRERQTSLDKAEVPFSICRIGKTFQDC